ncbi:MAG TPA: hypothetical protein VKG45_11525 [Actinomycetes bacterium]|nr:hypothetical protein [Actinomycetes bacterium]
MTTGRRWRLGVAVAVLCLLALLAGGASPGFPLPSLRGALGDHLARLLDGGSAPAFRELPGVAASRYALGDIPSDYLAYYIRTDEHEQLACPALTWQLLAGIGKIESDHGRSPAPGVHAGVNRHGCCAGPMQFNVNNGPPSTWDAFKRPGDSVYEPADAIPAAARKLCANGLATLAGGVDPCPHVEGTPAEHRALKRYNNACWYVHEVITLASRYTLDRPPPAGRDPFVRALLANPRITTTTSRGCDPAPDLASGNLDLRVQSLLAALADRWAIRISCARSGHSTYVKGTRRVSNHTVWRAVDIDEVDHAPVRHGNTAARDLALWLDRLDGPLRPAEVGSPWRLGHRPYFTDEGHQDHIHIGYGHLFAE